MEPVQQQRGAGLGLVGAAIAFFVVAGAGGQPAFLAVGVAFLVLGLGGRFRGRRKTPR